MGCEAGRCKTYARDLSEPKYEYLIKKRRCRNKTFK